MAAAPWRPGDLVLDETELAHVCVCMSFGQGDPGYDEIAQKLASRGCNTVDNLREWSNSEFVSVVRPLQLKKHPRAYLASMEMALTTSRRQRRSSSKVRLPCPLL